MWLRRLSRTSAAGLLHYEKVLFFRKRRDPDGLSMRGKVRERCSLVRVSPLTFMLAGNIQAVV
jgi:hypothetical protein